MKTKKLKPRRMWCDRELFAMPTEVVVCGNKREFADDLCVAVIPLDDPAAMIARASTVVDNMISTATIGDICRAVLVSSGVLPRAKKGGRK